MTEGYKKLNEVTGTVIVVLTTLLACSSILIPIKSLHGFKSAMDFTMLVCIVYGLAYCILERKRVDKVIVVLTTLYFVARLLSYAVNKIPITYGGSFMLQMFYLIGICTPLFGTPQRKKAVIYSFLAVDAYGMGMNYFNFYFRPEYVEQLVAEHGKYGMTPMANMFLNPNGAGLLAGAAIIACFAMVLDGEHRMIKCIISVFLILINLRMIFFDTGCRSAQTGLIICILVYCLLRIAKRCDSARVIIGTGLLICTLTLVPLYALVYHGDNEYYLSDVTETEQQLDVVSSGRYAFWKTTILSQKGHLLLGYGSNKRAVKARQEYINTFEPEKVDYKYMYIGTLDYGQHNGYLCMINETGLVGAILFLMILFIRVTRLKGSICRGQEILLLLIFIFWINLFESKFITVNYFTSVLMMVLLANNGKAVGWKEE